MSSVSSPWVLPAPTPSAAERRHGLLAPVPVAVGRRRRPRLLYAAIAVATLMGIVVVQLALSIGITNSAYQVTKLQNQQVQLARSYQAASEQVQELSSPQNLALSAASLGMVSNGAPVYLRLSDSKVIGVPTPAAAGTGTATSATGNLVPNALLGAQSATDAVPSKGVTHPSAAKHSATAAGPTKSSASAQQSPGGAPSGNAAKAEITPVPWTGQLPVPATH